MGQFCCTKDNACQAEASTRTYPPTNTDHELNILPQSAVVAAADTKTAAMEGRNLKILKWKRFLEEKKLTRASYSCKKVSSSLEKYDDDDEIVCVGQKTLHEHLEEGAKHAIDLT